MKLQKLIFSILMILIQTENVKSETISVSDISGVFEFDLQGSEYVQPVFRRLVQYYLENRANGLDNIDPGVKAIYEYYGLIKNNEFLEDLETIKKYTWDYVYERNVNSDDDYDRTPLIIDGDGTFYYVNGSDGSTERKRLCFIDEIGKRDGVRCVRDNYDDDKGIIVPKLIGEQWHIDISINGKPSQKYIQQN